MEDRQILILLRIGKMDVSQKCVDSVTVDRNFSDVGDKFSITLVDSPDTNILYDLELYMASGYRDITLKYGDISEDKLVGFNGTIWDYTNTFVGNIKKLTVTGIMSKYVENQEGVASYTYNIDWNSYFNKRINEKANYGAITELLVRDQLSKKYKSIEESLAPYVQSAWLYRPSDILDEEFKNKLYENSDTVSLKGPSGNIVKLPVPDCFYSTQELPSATDMSTVLENITEYSTEYSRLYDFMVDPNNKYWGKLIPSIDTQKQGAANVSAQLSPYLASSFLVSREKIKYTQAEYNTKSGFDSSSQTVTHVTSNLLDSLFGCIFPSLKINGIKLLSKFYISMSAVQDFYNEHYRDLDDKSYFYFWYEQPGEKKFYGKINLDNTQLNQYGRPTPKYTKYHLDDENGGNDVAICTNSAGAVVSFIFYRAGVPRGHFVAINYDYCQVVDEGKSKNKNMSDLIPSGKLNTMGVSSMTSIFSSYYTDGEVIEYNYHSAKLYKTDTSGTNFYLYDTDSTGGLGNLRGFIFPQDPSTGDYTPTLYLQANPNHAYGGAGFVSSGIGVDISDIVRRLAKLEGWKVHGSYETTSDIVQTELVANSDALRMKNQTALDFIVNNLVPKAITPIGKYATLDGSYEDIRTPQAGFYPFFDDDGYFHFQPLTKETVKKLDIKNLGYNLPNSPVISFQINTKGTAFYTYPNIQYNPINIVSGNLSATGESLTLVSESVAEEIARGSGHNDTFDDWLGLTYNDVEKAFGETSLEPDALFNRLKEIAQTSLVNKPSALLMGSGYEESDDILTKLGVAEKSIMDTVIKATMSLWGNTSICPACNINIMNMIKGGVSNSFAPQRHPSSGDYLILSMQDKIDGGSFIQNLNLLRYTDAVTESINKNRIDYSKKAAYENYLLGEKFK